MNHYQTAYIKRMMAYIKDDRAIAAHIKREYRAVWTIEEVAKFRSLNKPPPKRVRNTTADGLSDEEEALAFEAERVFTASCSRSLLKALRKHHSEVFS